MSRLKNATVTGIMFACGSIGSNFCVYYYVVVPTFFAGRWGEASCVYIVDVYFGVTTQVMSLCYNNVFYVARFRATTTVALTASSIAVPLIARFSDGAHISGTSVLSPVTFVVYVGTRR